jgi:hypothetical protein
MGFSGPVMTSAVLAPFFWFSAGIAAYWFAGPGRSVRGGNVPAGVVATPAG